MAGASFDILFAGELIEDADPDEARRQLQQRFKLSDNKAAQLFSGHTVSIKRGVDTATASTYRQIFRDAGALVEIRPVEAPDETPPKPPDESAPAPAPAWALAGAQPEERQAGDSLQQPSLPDAPKIDISHLSLVPGMDWTLEDCQPSPPPIKLPDISHLELVIPDADDEEIPS